MSSMASESEVDMTVLSPPLFNYGAYDLLGEWNRFFQKLKYYLVANGRADSPDEEKIGVLLSHLGNEGKAIYESLEAKDNPGERITSFEELTEALTSYFDSARNVLFERFKFFKMKRRSGQSVVAFARDLTIAASFCGFSEVDNIIRDKLLEQLEDKGLIERILVEGGSLTLARAINICQKWEERKSQANENKPPDYKDDPEPPNSSATIDSRRKLESELETATDYGGGFPAVTILGVVPQERQTTAPVNREGNSEDCRGLWDDAGPITHIDEEEYKPTAPIGLGTTIKEEQDACDSSPAAPSPQPHRWLPARDEPSSPHTDANQEIKMEPVEEDEEMTLHSPLVIPTAVSGIETDPLSADDQSKDLNPDGEIKMEPVDEEMAFHSPLVIPTAVSGIETDLLSADDQSKGLDPDGEIRMEPVDKDEEMTLHSPLVVPTAVSEIQTDSAGNQSKGGKNSGRVKKQKYKLENVPNKSKGSSYGILYDSNGGLVIPITPLNFVAPSPTSPEISPDRDKRIDSDDSCRDPLYSPTSTEIIGAEEIDIKVHPLLNLSEMEIQSREGKNQIKDKVKEKRVRVRDFCLFCKEKVLSFARHIARHHHMEPEVAKILSLPKKDNERSRLCTALRKKGNFLIPPLHEGIKPMNKRCQIPKSPFDYLPCSECLGLYAKKNLWRHRKACGKGGTKGHCQGSAQDLICGFNPLLDQDLKDKVFPTMRADKISLVAKTDSLITAFGARYLRSHNEKRFISVTSRMMRKLARLLIAVQEFHPEIKSLFACLHPKYFDTIVQAVRHESKFDVSTETYKFPTYAKDIATSLKQCCDVALLMLTNHPGNVLGSVSIQDSIKNVKVMHQLLVSQWRFVVPSTAANDSASKKCNVTMVTLASDLKLFSDYLIRRASEAAENLKNKPADITSYTDLLEISYCRLFLLNRRRLGELIRLPLHLYNLNSDPETHEEFTDVISPAEKILIRKFKCVVIRGNRGQSVPVLFNDELQKHISILLESRKHFFDSTRNYLFANPGCGSPITGYKVLQKHVSKCNAKNPKALMTTRLRKHLATMTQIFNMSPYDMEQLASFMGLTLGIYQKSYRLLDVYQTAKISKLLLVIEKGGASEFQGKTLDEIEINMESNLLEEQMDSEDEDDGITQEQVDDLAFTSSSNNKEEEAESRPAPTKKIRTVQPWSIEDKKEVAKYFRSQIQEKMAPRRHECEAFKKKYPKFKNRDWKKLKALVQNIYTNKCKIY